MTKTRIIFLLRDLQRNNRWTVAEETIVGLRSANGFWLFSDVELQRLKKDQLEGMLVRFIGLLLAEKFNHPAVTREA
jgi:hypothetical protein